MTNSGATLAPHNCAYDCSQPRQARDLRQLRLMKTEQEREATPQSEESKQRLLKEAGGGVIGAVGGAGLGVLAGPPGIAAGAVIGAVVGTLTSWAMVAGSSEAEATDERLDREIGVDGGDIGVETLEHPPAQRGAFSAAASGATNVAPDDEVTSEGPIASPPGE